MTAFVTSDRDKDGVHNPRSNHPLSAKYQNITRICVICYIYLGFKITLALVSSIYNYSYNGYLVGFSLYSNNKWDSNSYMADLSCVW